VKPDNAALSRDARAIAAPTIPNHLPALHLASSIWVMEFVEGAHACLSVSRQGQWRWQGQIAEALEKGARQGVSAPRDPEAGKHPGNFQRSVKLLILDSTNESP
jgi:hypothetical protein